jgi:hypothetical protein
MDLAPWKGELDPSLLQRIDGMAEELARQAADITAAEYRWLALLAEFDAIGGWAVGGARSCADWLSWACGVSLPAAREKVRVAKALGGLPLISAAFAAGRMSYSKVRAVTRVATPANEALLVTYAESATAAQLETVVRGYRRSQRAEEGLEAHRRFERRSVRWWVDDEGYVRISARLAPDDGALVVAELERLAESGGEDEGAAAEPVPPGTRVSAETAEAGRGDAPVVQDRLDAAEPAEARRADALRMMAETAAANGPTACRGGETHLVVVHATERELSDTPTDLVVTAVDDIGVTIEGVGRVSAETARRLGCDAEVVTLTEDRDGRPLSVGRSSRNVPRWLRRALRRRDGGRCRFPGCNVTRFVDAHHIWHWADGGPTELDNLMLLCRFHHRLVHEVGYQIRVNSPGDFTFLRPDDTPVPEMPEAPEGDGHAVAAANRKLGLDITETTAIPDWDGHPPDYSWAIEVLARVSAETAPEDEPHE